MNSFIYQIKKILKKLGLAYKNIIDWDSILKGKNKIYFNQILGKKVKKFIPINSEILLKDLF